ncbi:MAG TPA: hypothetical protein VFB96_21575 [Pirellulaceae bacterium]|nr:hypothetical protein [Pirellulaceae bacterium]
MLLYVALDTSAGTIAGDCLARPQHQAHDHSGNDTGTETNRQRFGGAFPHHALDFGVPFTHRCGGLIGRFLDGISRLLGTGPSRLASPAECGGAVRRELLEKLLDVFSRLARSSLDHAHKLIHIAIEKVVIRERAPPATQLAFDLVPISLKCLLVDHLSVHFLS